MICREGSIFFPMDIENFVFTCPYVSNVTAVINENEIVLCVITTEEAPKILEESLMKLFILKYVKPFKLKDNKILGQLKISCPWNVGHQELSMSMFFQKHLLVQ